MSDKIIAVNKANGTESPFTKSQWDALDAKWKNVFTLKQPQTPKEVIELQEKNKEAETQRDQEAETPQISTQVENEAKTTIEKRKADKSKDSGK